MSYRVIEIMDKKNIIINYGYRNGAKKGDEVRVIEVGEEVIDPVKNESIGTLDLIKVTAKIIKVYDNFSICADVQDSVNTILNPLTQFSQVLVNTERTYNEMNVLEEQITNRKFPRVTPIKVGDLVEIVK